MDEKKEIIYDILNKLDSMMNKADDLQNILLKYNETNYYSKYTF